MRLRSAAGVLATSAALFFVASAPSAPRALAGAGGEDPPRPRSERVRLLDVPYLPQSEALCGGAAVAMVLRYWGDATATAEEFAPRLEPDGSGIRTDVLVDAVRARGWTAFPLKGTAEEVRGHLARGRPVIALVRAGSRSPHYVVVVAWANGGVIVHDPAAIPFRAERAEAFERAWAPGGRWALLILPPSAPDSARAPLPAADSSRAEPPSTDTLGTAAAGCDSIVAEGVRRARLGQGADGEQWIRAAAALCPESAAPWRELAGLRFRADDWAGASTLASRALALDPRDEHAARLLGGSRFLAGDVEGALRAWNRLGEPRTTVARIDGLSRIRYRVVASQIDLPPDRVLTAPAYRRARRRLEEIPARSGSRLALRPLPRGEAQMTVSVLERPLVFDGAWDAAGAAVRAAVERSVTLEVASPTGNGELWSADWRWQSGRPRVRGALTVPLSGWSTGIVRVESFWERQTYSDRAISSAAAGDTAVAPGSEALQEDRRRAAISFGDWAGANLRVEAGVAVDRWDHQGATGSLEGAVEARDAGDRVSIEARAAGWSGGRGRTPFHAGRVLARWGSRGLATGPWEARAGAERASRDAPFAVWPGAGAGKGRVPLLRAHPLLAGGLLDGPVFGRTLVHGGVERGGWMWRVGPVRVGWSLFLDAARAWDRADTPRSPWHVDGGAGLRLAGLGRGSVRVDAAHGFQDGAFFISARWDAR